jgi:XTP/dITP diphosphohydrolase
MQAVCFATNNLHKLEEVRSVLGSDFRVFSLDEILCKEELPETGDTLEANAYQKANYVFEHYKQTCFADDTGLEVEALHQAPGVYSARYAGPQRNSEHNIELLLKNLTNVENRRARFRTVICWVSDKETLNFEGIVEGEIIHERRGSQGFGYDSVFVPAGYSKTFAEMTMEEKNTLSHRSRAVSKLVKFLKG